MSRHIPNPDPGHPPEWRDDLNPDFMAGRNVGLQGPHPDKDARTAFDVKPAHRQLTGFTDDELKRVPIVPAGIRLEQGATYVDLRALDEGEFTATGQIVATDNHWFVPKSEVDYDLWNRLVRDQ
jgi:hypothetical protein